MLTAKDLTAAETAYLAERTVLVLGKSTRSRSSSARHGAVGDRDAAAECGQSQRAGQ